MAVAKTGAMFKTFTFDGETSRDYGIYITGAASYNAPERAVEMISIPGRNGSFALDKGRFENIEVTYPAGVFAENEADFADAISEFRNMLCSKKGYCRLTDDYNPNEYRMAIYKSGLEIEPSLLRAGEFEITFECKPQRFLTSGENAVTVTSGGTITNPTRFPSSPMLELTGYGDIFINSDRINVDNGIVGDVIIHKDEKYPGTSIIAVTVPPFVADMQFANVGDTITAGQSSITNYWKVASGTITNASAVISGNGYGKVVVQSGDKELYMPLILYSNFVYYYGTASTNTVSAAYTIQTTAYGTKTASISLSLAYDGASTFTLSYSVTGGLPNIQIGSKSVEVYFGELTLNSTQSKLGNPLYLDLDIGEAYKTEGGSTVSVNRGITMPPELPTLKPGSNMITYDNTFTDVQIVPRWWKV